MFLEIFKEHLAKFSTAPFLFVGSGFSRRYIGMETWIELLSSIHQHLDLKKPFRFYTSNAVNLPEVASLMGNEFNEVWWVEEPFSESRKIYQDNATNKYSPLKFEVSKYIQEKGIEIKDLMEEIDLLKEVQIDGILTTNWDLLLESFFPDFKKIIGQEELIFSETLNVAEIYKIHGCVSNPESLILTAEDYKDFNERNQYLAAKLLTIFMEHPIVFLGYSLDDLNVQEIFKNIIGCLTRNNINKLKDRLIFCQWSSEQKETTILDSTLMINGTVIPIKLIEFSSYVEIFKALGNLKKRIPVKILRQMKEMIYEFVKENEPKSNIYVADSLDQLDSSNVGFVYGVGIKDKLGALGIKGIDARSLLRDVIVEQNWNALQICELLLPTLKNQFIPYFKYLRNAQLLDEKGNLQSSTLNLPEDFVNKVNSIKISTFYPNGTYLLKKDEVNAKYGSFKALLAGEQDFVRKLILAPLLDPDKIDLKELRSFLKSHLDSLVHSYHGTHFRKLICLYDYLSYKT
ncbi:SIR2 family protein [Sphingobacterium sp. UDSM-2020]|uniref:SIR2 family protein n=1 Tax=Sphingobacterium sp. UDSM-2020 TaxID=2795738 RepID=UPI001936F5AD|nr:SIR2 family protein [Sphingobacterium sp. UDSM-2020]QQD13142.1 SIR2 family protein [Sphingobacterium sp. UDSM-2020]